MSEMTVDEEIDAIVDKLIGPQDDSVPTTLLGGAGRRLDVSKQNFHESKEEFNLEKEAVEAVIKNLESAISRLVLEKGNMSKNQMLERLSAAINTRAVRVVGRQRAETSVDLALSNVAQSGFSHVSLMVMAQAVYLYNDRLKELLDQEERFWSVAHRPPNHYARTIALRLARLYAKHKRKKPTYGAARDGGHPSTEFGRALEEIYEVLGITASVHNQAKWAISQLTEEDINPPANALGLLNYMSLKS
ncbi:hypothetical protein [Actibacterium pelagium]|uniref:Uncharacterized protein n=1 Tax=Actibacterium pelagium TaxID=2029103 RepID=A0A917AKE3_9RHOB|nr:hypothetical protein [Actibacterium pelagium]GGE57989.1 hypothetical protein GCM10011517_27240 [Actibacterium pelagium]